MLFGNYLITGATGRMGTHALLRFKEQPHIHIRAVYHKKEPFIFADNITYIQADLTNLDHCKRITEDIDYVFMFGGILSTSPVMAKNPVSHVTKNMIMNSHILEASYFADVKKFLWLSSTTGYPILERCLTEEKMFVGDPPDHYFSVGWMTRYTEILCRMYATKLKKIMPCIVLRPTTIYSEYGDYNFETCHVLPAMVRKVVERHNPIEVWGTGEVKRDLIYADDVVDACLLALEQIKTFDVFNIGYEQDYSINELLKIIIELDNFNDVNIVYNPLKPTAVNKRTIDFTKAKQILKFEPKTSIREGIHKMIEWYKKNPIY